MANLMLSIVLATTLIAGCGNQNAPQGAASTYLVSSAAEVKSLSLKPGDTVVWKDGTYENVKITLSGNGMPDNEICLKSQTPGGVVFTGTSGISLNGSYLLASGFHFQEMDTSVKNAILTAAKSSSHCTFTYCSIDGSATEQSMVDTKWVNLYGSANEVSHCTFVNKRNMGCLFVVWLENGIVPAHTIAFNKFTRPLTIYDENGQAKNGQEAIRIGTSDYSMQDANCIVKGNFFLNCNGELAEIISNKSCGNVYEGNVFEDCKGSLTLRHGNRCTVRGNYFIGTGCDQVGGVRIIGEDHLVENNVMLNLTGDGYKAGLCVVRGESDALLNGYWTVKNAVVRSNVFVNCAHAVVVNMTGRSTQDTAPENLTVKDNVIYSDKNSYVAVEVMDMQSEKVNWENNVIWGGKQKNCSLDLSPARPSIEDYSSVIDEIKHNAGTQR